MVSRITDDFSKLVEPVYHQSLEDIKNVLIEKLDSMLDELLENQCTIARLEKKNALLDKLGFHQDRQAALIRRIAAV